MVSGPVLLIGNSTRVPRNIGTYRVATALRNAGVEVHVLDFLPYLEPEMVSTLARLIKPVWIGISTPWEYSQNHTQVTEELLNALSRVAPLVIGGANAFSFIKLKTIEQLSYAVGGFADISVVELHKHIVGEHDISNKFQVVNGVNFIDSDKLYPVTDMSTLTTEFMPEDFITENERIPIEISRGCIFKCAFCTFSLIGKAPGTYFRPAEDIKADIQRLHDAYGTEEFLFCDDTFNDCVEKMQMIVDIQESLDFDFGFWSYARLDLLEAKPEMVDLIDKCGWKSMSVGIETLNRDSGKAVYKGADPNKLIAFLEKFRKSHPHVGLELKFIVGLPHDTKESIERDLRWLRDNSHLFDLATVRSLFIHDKNAVLSPSAMSLDPKKYGYTVLKSLDQNVEWKTEHLTSGELGRYNRIRIGKIDNWTIQFKDPEKQREYVNNYLKKKIEFYQKMLT